MKLHFVSSSGEASKNALTLLTKRYGQTEATEDSDVIVSLGGDGQTLHALQLAIRYKKPVFGLNFGHAGFLQNAPGSEDDLIQRIERAESVTLSPFKLKATFLDGSVRSAFAINEVHICNHNRAEGIYLRVLVDQVERVPRLGADGLIIATSVGSTGYSKSAGGTILPLGDDMIAFTPNNAFLPDRMRPSVIRPHPIEVEVIDPVYRHADLYADTELIGRNCKSLVVDLAPQNAFQLLFDPGYNLHERVMRTQFATFTNGA